MLATFTVCEEVTDDFDVDGNNLPNELFRSLKEGILNAFRVDLVDGFIHVTISGDNDKDQLLPLVVTYADGPHSVEYHESP